MFNREWDALWKVRTHITDTSWTAEMAIPWKTLRYPENTNRVGVIFTRNIRRLNEFDVMPAVPRRFNIYRMAYEGVISNIEPPPPTPNVQINPYLFYSNNQVKEGTEPLAISSEPKIGGEIKWAINPNTVLDATINTDFAQADVDRQVVNLSRFSVLFPERRQFFLEGANIFNASVTSFIQPFFSRQIGIDENGNSIPIDGGLRFTQQSSKSSTGALLVRQQGTNTSPLTYFGIGRYSKNLGSQNKLGGMITYRGEYPSASDTSFKQHNNYTATADGFFRLGQETTINAMVSGSKDDVKGNGLASQVLVAYQNNLVYIGLLEYFVKNYNPGIGLERFGRDYLFTSPAIDFDIRPKWLPKSIRSLGPDISAFIFHNPANWNLIQAEGSISFIDIEFQNGSNFEIRHNPTWQVLDESFSPVNITIAPGSYFYNRTQFSINTDFSRKYAVFASYETGNYFDGKLNTTSASLRIAPVPHAEFSLDYEYNQLRDLGISEENKNTHLIGINSRLALNPRVQLTGFYQYNSNLNRNIWNVRLAWEYRPLSYLFVVFNRNDINSLDATERFTQNQFISKITFLKQF